MRQVANAKARVESLIWTPNALPLILAGNTVVLFAVEWQHGIPGWLKAGVQLFLAF
jgi:hypothetical protein